ncbi:class I adenylate-forming enzyme family protein [Phenylobacterium sp.]|uniref:class I adenylate-forming enzyme family protein n=1 Tax=Phenylobacterium sp. TaxID=1871053 RepID=UPI0035AFF90F
MRISHLVERAARLSPDRLALVDEGGDYTYAEMRRISRRIANALLRDGYGPGSRFAVYSPNSAPAMLAILGGLLAGGVWCAVNLRNAVSDNADILARGDCQVIFHAAATAAEVEQICAAAPSVRTSICLDDLVGGAWLGDAPDSLPQVRLDRSAVVFQGSTGGTTGAPKITMCGDDWLTMSALAWATCLRYEAPPVNLAATPITHAAGMMALSHLVMGGTVVLMPRFEVGELLRAIEAHRVTTVFLPPTIIYMLLAHPELATRDTSSLRYVLSSAAPIAPAKIAELMARLGPVFAQAWGQTETGFPMTFISPAEVEEALAEGPAAQRLLSCGRQTLVVEALEVLGPDGDLLGPGQQGELVLRGPTVMQGYRADPAATEEVQRGGWHHTGDVGWRDEAGYVYITDRLRDVIISGGFNLYPFEIEQVLLQHPQVQDCAVIGVPDDIWGESVKAVVQARAGEQPSAEELIGFCRERLGGMKAPKTVDLVDDLPRTPVGKVLKRELRGRYWAGQTRNIH